MRPFTRIVLLLFSLTAIFALAAAPASAQKTDTIIFRNGDHLTCEIKFLDQAKLSVKTVGLGTISIEWDEIAELISDKYLRVELDTGESYYGSFGKPEEPRFLRVALGTWNQDFKMSQVVGIQRIKSSFWARLDGSLSFGLSFTLASEVLQTNLGFTTRYRSERNTFDLSYSAIATLQRTEDPTHRQDGSFTWEYILKDKWFSSTAAGYQQNEQLGISNRLLGKLGSGLHAIKNNYTILSGLAGLSLNREWPTNDFPKRTSLEVWLEADFNYFLYDSPKTNIDITLDIFPSLTISGRVRAELEFKVSRELISDLMFDVSVYMSLDNKPPDPTAGNGDWGLVTGISWTY